MVRRLRQLGRNGHRVGSVRPGHQHAIFTVHDLGRDGGNLFRCLAGTEYDLGKSLPQRAVRVDLREAKIVDRLCAEGVEQGGFVHFAGLESMQKLAGFLWCHRLGINISDGAASRGIAPRARETPLTPLEARTSLRLVNVIRRWHAVRERRKGATTRGPEPKTDLPPWNSKTSKALST